MQFTASLPNDQKSPMTETQTNSAITQQIVALLSHYGFDLRGHTAEELAFEWLSQYHQHWVRLAVIEALYQGRYKAISIDQILNFWERRQHPIFHFNHEFERLICRKLPRHLNAINDPWYEDSIDYDEDYDYDSLYSYWSDHDFSVSSDSIDSQESDLTVAEELQAEYNIDEESVEETPPEPPFPFTPEKSSKNEELQPTIHRFKPSPDASDFYQKLKAVAKHSVEKKAQ